MNCPICGKHRTFWECFIHGVAHADCLRKAREEALAEPRKPEGSRGEFAAIVFFVGFVILLGSEFFNISGGSILGLVVLIVGLVLWIVSKSPRQEAAPFGTKAGGAFVREIRLGMTPGEVESALGLPETKADLGEKVLYKYKNMTVEFHDGKVTDVK
jgi:hypothetical protein